MSPPRGMGHMRGFSDGDSGDNGSSGENLDNFASLPMEFIIIFTVLGTILTLAVFILILWCVCRKCFGRTCKISWEASSSASGSDYSSNAKEDDFEDVIVCYSSARGRTPDRFRLPQYDLNRGFTPAPDDPIFAISQLGPCGGYDNPQQIWEYDESVQPGSVDTFVYDGRLRSPVGRSAASTGGDSGLAFRDDGQLQELCRSGMTRSETIMVGSKLVVFISREVNHLGDTLVLDEMGISLSIPPGAVKAGRKELISLILDWDLGDFPSMRNEETIISPVVHCGPHGLKLKKPAILSYKHCAYDLGDVSLVASETHLMQTKDWREVCGRNNRSRPYTLLSDEVQVQVSHFTLYTCLAEGKIATKKWMQLAVFGGKMKATYHYEIRMYFLNNTPCALQFAIQNEEKNHFKMLCPRKEFLFHGDGEDMMATVQHVNEGWSCRLDDRQERVPFLNLWHGKCPHVSFIFKHENEHVRDIDIRLVVNQRGREDNETAKTNLKILASMKSNAARHRSGSSTGTNKAVIHVYPPGKHSRRRRYDSVNSSQSDSSYSTSSQSSIASSSRTSSSSSSSSTSDPTSDTNTNDTSDKASKPTEQCTTQQSCTQNMQIHIHPSSSDLPDVGIQRTISHELCMELVVLLDPLAPLGNDWRLLATALEMDSLIPFLKNTPTYNPTETLLEEVERQAKGLEWLTSVMVKAKRLDAANVVVKYMSSAQSSCTKNESL